MWKTFVPHVCHNFCQALTLQMLAGTISIWAPVFSQISLFLPWHAEFHYNFSETTASLCAVGVKDGKVFPLFNWTEKLVTAAAGVCWGSSRAMLAGGHTTAHLISNERKAWESAVWLAVAGDLYFHRCGLSSASSRFTALPYQNLPGFAMPFRLTAGKGIRSLNVDQKNLQRPVGCWNVLIYQRRFSPSVEREGWGTALPGHNATMTSGDAFQTFSGQAAWYCISDWMFIAYGWTGYLGKLLELLEAA